MAPASFPSFGGLRAHKDPEVLTLYLQNYAEDSLRPITVKQILDAEETSNEFRIDGQHVTQVTLVGQVRSIQKLETNLEYKIDDGTGIVDVKKYIDIDKMATEEMNAVLDEDADSKKPAQGHGSVPIEEGSFVRVHGRIKSFNNKRWLNANFVRVIADYNEVNYHLLEATLVHLVNTKGPLGGAGAGAGGSQHDGGDSMFVDGGYGGGGAGMGGGAPKTINGSALAQRMFAYMQTAPGGNEGIPVTLLSNSLGVSIQDTQRAADELLSHGVIYTTVDDDTWAILDY